MNKIVIISLSFIATFLINVCESKGEDQAQALKTRVAEIQAQYTPDLRLDLFETTIDANAKKARVETTSAEARDAVKELAADFSEWTIEAALYPEENPELNGNWRALVNYSAIQLQKKPDYAAEWGTQSVMGMPVRIIKKASGGWIMIQNYDGYFGYTTAGSVCPKSKEAYDAWANAKHIVSTELHGHIYSKPSSDSATISDLTAGCIVLWKDSAIENGFYQVETPNGRVGWIPETEGMEWNQWLATRELTADNIIKTARLFLGSPYVWGGNTSNGMDCSGLVNICFRLNGYSILRDVSQIRREGIDVDRSEGWKNYRPGDLLIFGKHRADGSTSWRHVAIYLGDARFIHSATSVHESSLDPESPDYDPGNAKELIKVVRMIGAPHTEHYRPLGENQFLHY